MKSIDVLWYNGYSERGKRMICNIGGMYMNYPLLNSERSQYISEKRINHAIEFLGEEVVTRILAFSSYLLGWSMQEVAESLNYSVPGLKSLIQQVLMQGVGRFIDHRKNETLITSMDRKVEEEKTTVEVSLDENQDNVIIDIKSAILRLNTNDTLLLKAIAMVLVDSDVLSKKAASEIMGSKPLAVMKNYKVFKEEGANGLVDKRTGQKGDYKFDSKVKGELCYGYSMNILKGEKASDGKLARYLTDTLGKEFSRRSVSYHMNLMGLNIIRPRLEKDTQEIIKEGLTKKGR